MRKLLWLVCNICMRSVVQIIVVCIYVYTAKVVTLKALLETKILELLKKAFGKQDSNLQEA